MEFVVCASDFDPDIGGIVCLHALSDCLAELGHTVCLAPLIHEVGWDPFSPWFSIKKVIRNYLDGMRPPRLVGSRNVRPIAMDEARTLAQRGACFVYPETVLGNPYGARRVIRWLLHFPVFHQGEMHWTANDWVVRFNDAIPRVQVPGIRYVERTLKVVRYPIDMYVSNRSDKRTGSAYLVRKGVNKPVVHPPDAICIDGMSHAQTSEVLGRVETFYSYDAYTSYSYLAVLAGCVSVVVPDENLALDAWYPSEADRWGLAYGESMIEWAKSTAHFVQSRLQAEEAKSLEDVRMLLLELDA